MSLHVENSDPRRTEDHFALDGFTGTADLRAFSLTLEIDVVSIPCRNTRGSEKHRRKLRLSRPSAALGVIGTKDETRFTFRVALAESRL